MNKMLRWSCLCCLALSWVLGSYRGYVALYDKGKTEPRMVYPYAVAALPPADQEALVSGIRVITQEELSRLLEDFLS